MSRSLSVIIPSYNHARFIAEAIESVAAQGEPDLELVVVDDGSTDESVEVIQSVLAEVDLAKVRFIQQQNQGAPAAIARGVAASSGQLVTILNSDDTFTHNRFSKMRESFPKEGDFFAFSMVNMVGDDNSLLPSSSEAMAGYRHALYESSQCPTVGYALLKINFAVTSGNFVFTRSLYDKLEGFRDYDLAHDWDFALRALYHVEPIFVPERLLNYRTHLENARHGLKERSLDEGRKILNDYVSLCDVGTPPNRIAPCEKYWPVFFDLFVSHHEPWFDREPLGTHLDRPLRARSDGETVGWRPWSPALDFHPVPGRSYFSGSEPPSASLESIAVASFARMNASDPRASEYGVFTRVLGGVLGRQTGHFQLEEEEPWLSPFFGAVKRKSTLPKRGIAVRTWSFVRHALARAAQIFEATPFRSSQARVRLKERRAVRQIESSGAFDFAHYRKQTPNVDFDTPQDAILHYLREGSAFGLDPNPFFGSEYYVETNPDIAVSGANPFLHYLLFGEAELRQPHPQFEPAFYRKQFEPALTLGESMLVHYAEVGKKEMVATTRASATRAVYTKEALSKASEQSRERSSFRYRSLGRLRRSQFFDADYYAAQARAQGMTVTDPARHLVDHGALEGIPFLSPERMSAQLWELGGGDLNPPEFSYMTLGYDRDRTDSHDRVAIYSSSLGNSFHLEMAKLLAHAFARIGSAVELRDETADVDEWATHSIVVAPHEFFGLGNGKALCTPKFLERSHLFLAEQPGSSYFSVCLWYAYRSRGILDINPLSSLLWTDLGIEARAFPLGYIDDYPAYEVGVDFSDSPAWNSMEPEDRAWKAGASDSYADRPIDIFFNGVLSDRREWFFACHARTLSKYRCALFIPIPNAPLGEGMPSALNEKAATGLSQRAKIHVNVHQRDLPYFEWHRNVVRSMWQKTLLVTERSYRVPGLNPGEHYIECDLGRMTKTLEWLLDSPDGRAKAERVRQNAFKALTETYPMDRILSAFLADPWSRGQR